MLDVSDEYRRKVEEGCRVLAKATIAFADGTTRDVSGDDIMMGGLTIEDATSSASSFDIGAAIMGKLTLTLNNSDERFSDLDFTGAVVTPWLGVELDDGTTEWLRRGEYEVDQPSALDSTVRLTGLDNMRLLERPYSDVPTEPSLLAPVTLGRVVGDICDACGVTLATPEFANHLHRLTRRPDDSALTCLAVIGYAAQITGNYARMNNWGELEIGWYDNTVWEAEDGLDGDRFDGDTPYSSGDTADGGDFLHFKFNPYVYNSGAKVDGGSFAEEGIAYLTRWSGAPEVISDDVVVTGVQVTAQDGEDALLNRVEGETYLYGSAGYVLTIENNPLAECGNARAIAGQVGRRIVGVSFRPFAGSALARPDVEAGDPAYVIDRKGNRHRSFITRTTFKLGVFQEYGCGAKTPSRNSATTYTEATRAIVEQRKAIKEEVTARKTAQEALAKRLADSSGLYMTTEAQGDGSSIYYMHDKPELSKSTIIWKLTAEAFAISTDGGKTYPYGLSATGDAILQRIYAIGLDADYINAGSISADYISGGTLKGVKVVESDGQRRITLENGQMYFDGYAWAAWRRVGELLASFASDGTPHLQLETDGLYVEAAKTINVQRGTSTGGVSNWGTLNGVYRFSIFEDFSVTYNESSRTFTFDKTWSTYEVIIVHGRIVSISKNGITVNPYRSL